MPWFVFVVCRWYYIDLKWPTPDIVATTTLLLLYSTYIQQEQNKVKPSLIS